MSVIQERALKQAIPRYLCEEAISDSYGLEVGLRSVFCFQSESLAPCLETRTIDDAQRIIHYLGMNGIANGLREDLLPALREGEEK